MRCAVGAALAKPDGEFNIYRRVFAHSREVAENEDWNAFADGLAGDVRRVAETVAEADLKTTKVRYDVEGDGGRLRSDRGTGGERGDRGAGGDQKRRRQRRRRGGGAPRGSR